MENKTNQTATSNGEQIRKPTDLETDGLFGKVNHVMLTTYKAHQRGGVLIQGKIENDYSLYMKNHITTYDKNGMKILAKLFGSDGRNDKKYDSEGREIESKQYDRLGNLYQATNYVYDKKGNCLEVIARDGEGNLSFRMANIYNEAGLQIESNQYTGKEENLAANTITIYDEKNNLLSSIQYNPDGSVHLECLCTYDAQGRQLERTSRYTQQTMDKYFFRHVNRYNSHGDCIETKSYASDGKLKDTYSYEYEYDTEGNKIIPQIIQREEESTAETEEIENDAQGNWVKKTMFYNKIPMHILLREIAYFDDKEEKQLIHPFTYEPLSEVGDTSKHIEDLSEEDAQWLVETPAATAENFPYFRYYVLQFKESPSCVTYTGPYIEVLVLRDELKANLDAHELHSYSTIWGKQGEHLVRYTLAFKNNSGYLFHCVNVSANDSEEFEIPRNMPCDDGYVYLGQVQLLRPSEASGKRDEFFEEELEEFIQKCSLKKRPDKPMINMIETTDKGFVMQEHAVDDNFEIRDLDVNYGYGFEKFHEELMHRFNTGTKGLVLFHGQPGTGKTYYIRHLLREMAANKKVVIYMPPNMVDRLVEPSFMTFLTEAVREWSENGNFCVLLIEDAEPLLAKRQEGVRIQGVTNLLNMSDGLLNDMLNLQIICTFNVDLKKLDSALLRPGRLIARKEFQALGTLDANLLAQRLGIKHHFTAPATLGEIYALRKHKNILVHEVEPDLGASSLLDDL